jgi:hypothetical protein
MNDVKSLARVKGVDFHSLKVKPWTLIGLKLSSAFHRASCLIEQKHLFTLDFSRRVFGSYGPCPIAAQTWHRCSCFFSESVKSGALHPSTLRPIGTTPIWAGACMTGGRPLTCSLPFQDICYQLHVLWPHPTATPNDISTSSCPGACMSEVCFWRYCVIRVIVPCANNVATERHGRQPSIVLLV